MFGLNSTTASSREHRIGEDSALSYLSAEQSNVKPVDFVAPCVLKPEDEAPQRGLSSNVFISAKAME